MNNKLSTAYLFLIITLFLFSCHEPVKEKNKTNASAGSFSLHVGNEKYITIDTKETVVTWKGSNSFGAHTGYIYISKGELMMENVQLVGGTIEVDMNTIEDEGHGRSSGLINHLKDADFFEVKKFPFSTISIIKVEPTNGKNIIVTANLTIKGMTQPVTFPATIEVMNGIVKTNGKLIIDRTNWGINYKSGKFDAFLADKAISDSIEFNIKIVAKK